MSAIKKRADKHFLIFYKRGTGTFIVTEPRPWARENQAHFPNYDFISDEPTTNTICDYLVKEFNFVKQVDKSGIKAFTNLDPDLNIDR